MDAIAPALPVDPQGCIDTDLPCLNCGYNLRGLPSDGACPECAAAIRRSTHGDWLQFHNPDWLKQLASGAGWLAAAQAGYLVAVPLTIAANVMGRGLLPEVIAIVFCILPLVGCWKLTTPDPGAPERASTVTLRRASRVAVCVLVVVGLLRAALILCMGTGHVALELFLAITALVHTSAWLVYVRRLLLRIPRRGLALQARMITCLFVAEMSLSWGERLLLSSPPVWAIVFNLLLLITYSVWSTIMVLACRRAFRQLAHDASTTWQGPPTGQETSATCSGI